MNPKHCRSAMHSFPPEQKAEEKNLIRNPRRSLVDYNKNPNICDPRTAAFSCCNGNGENEINI